MVEPKQMSEQMAALFAALALAGKAAHDVAKDARNEFHRYNYTSAEAIYREVRAALHAHGLALVPVASTLRGDAEKGYVVDLTFELTHAEGGSMTLSRSWPVIPDRGRPLDKAVAGALTTALSYLGRDLLLLPRVDEEVDKREDRPHEKGPPKRERVPQRRQAPQDGPPPGAEAEDLRERIAALLPQVPEAKRPAVQKAIAAAGDNVERLRAGLAFVKNVVEQAEVAQEPTT